MKKFSIWLEEKDYIQDTVIGVFGGGNELSDQGRKDILRRNTDEFSNKIIDDFFNLGVVKNIFEKNPNKLIYIRNMVKRGILIQDLINKLRGENLAPNAKISNF